MHFNRVPKKGEVGRTWRRQKPQRERLFSHLPVSSFPAPLRNGVQRLLLLRRVESSRVTAQMKIFYDDNALSSRRGSFMIHISSRHNFWTRGERRTASSCLRIIWASRARSSSSRGGGPSPPFANYFKAARQSCSCLGLSANCRHFEFSKSTFEAISFCHVFWTDECLTSAWWIGKETRSKPTFKVDRNNRARERCCRPHLRWQLSLPAVVDDDDDEYWTPDGSNNSNLDRAEEDEGKRRRGRDENKGGAATKSVQNNFSLPNGHHERKIFQREAVARIEGRQQHDKTLTWKRKF